jgi:hypothetical protein
LSTGPEVEDFDQTRFVHHHICGLQIAVDDPGRVSGSQASGNLRRILQGLVDPQAPAGDQTVEGLAGDVLHRDEVRRFTVFGDGRVDVVDVKDIGVIQRGSGSGFLDEALPPFRIGHGRRREHFNRHTAAEVQIMGRVDDPHAALAQLRFDSVVT